MNCFSSFFKQAILWVITVGTLGVSGAVYPQANEQRVSFMAFRTGPVGALSAAINGAAIDYMNLINDRDGGVNGVKLVWEECETEYKTDRGIECYERLKNRATMFIPVMTGTIYALIERTHADKIPIVSIGTGRTDSTDGRVFPYVFPLAANYLMGNTAKINFIGQREGGMDKLKGKKIVNLHHGSPFGRETMQVLDAQAAKYGFSLVHIEVPGSGAEQQAQWLQIRQFKPDWVILRSVGLMTSAAIKTAQRVGYPADRIVGLWWTSELDLISAGSAAKGVIANTFSPSGRDFPVVKEILTRYYSGGKRGNMEDSKVVGSTTYNSGLLHAILIVEAVRTAQKKFGKKAMDREQMRWGFEHLNIDAKRIKELGTAGLVQPLKTSCSDHTGGGAVKFQQWDGQNWVAISDWVSGDPSLVDPMIHESAAKYAKEKGITPRDCSKE